MRVEETRLLTFLLRITMGGIKAPNTNNNIEPSPKPMIHCIFLRDLMASSPGGGAGTPGGGWGRSSVGI